MLHNISVQEALDLVLNTASHLPTETVSSANALNRILATPLLTTESIPPFDNAGVDGFVVRMHDVAEIPAILPVAGCISAGKMPTQNLVSPYCMQIMTGAPVPEGSEAVVMVEWTERLSETQVQINRAPFLGQHIRRAGSDLPRNALVFEAGTKLNAPALGMLATLGYAVVSVYQRPKVALITTGDEVVEAHETPEWGQIRNSNGAALAAQILQTGAEMVYQGHARDTKESVRQQVQAALHADVLLFSGGVSMGEFDFVRVVLDEMGWKPLFWKVRQRPGKPLAFGTLRSEKGTTFVFGLPGNPVSSSVCFEQYVRPILQKMQGASTFSLPTFYAILETPFAKVKGLHFFSRGIAQTDPTGQMIVRSAGEQGSHIYSSMAHANCLVHLPEDWESAQAGTIVQCSRLP